MSARLFISGGGEILSKEKTTQEVPTARKAYALGILPLIHFLLEFILMNYLSAKKIKKDLVNDWNNKFALLQKVTCIIESQSRTTYSAFVSGFKSKLIQFMRTISLISQFLDPLEETIRKKFIPAITWGYICNNNKQQLLPLPTRYGGLAIRYSMN